MTSCLTTAATNRTPRRLTGRVLTGAVLAALALAGCTSDREPEDTSPASWQKVDLPASTVASGPAASLTATLGATGNQPTVLLGIEAESGEPAQARAWTPEGAGWRWVELPTGDGDAAVSDAFTDGSTTWVTGTRWTTDGVLPYLVSSTDRASWQREELPDEVFWPSSGVVASGGPLLLGTGEDFAPVAVTAGEDGKLTTLPMPDGDQEFRGFSGATVLGDEVVALARVGAPGAPDQSALYRSEDGREWSITPGPQAAGLKLEGLVATGGTLVATGSVSAGSGAAAAAWSSADGSTWTQESLPPLTSDKAQFWPDDDDTAWLDGPAAQGDQVVAVVSTNADLSNAVVVRNAAGTWSLRTHTTPWSTPGAAAVTAWNEDGTVAVALSDSNTARAGTVSDSGWRVSSTSFGTLDFGLRWSRLLPGPEQETLVARRLKTTTLPGGGWQRTSSASTYVLPPSGPVTDGTWDPAEAADLSDVLTASAEDGSQLLIGDRTSTGAGGETTVNVTGWHRPGPDAPWSPISGLQTTATEFVYDAARVGDRWIAAGSTRASFAITDRTQASVWSSTDGTAWTRHQGEFAADAAGDTWASAVCALPTGEPVVVGSATTAGQSRPLAWRLEGDQWVRLPGEALGDRGTVSSCTQDGEVTVLQGTLDGRATVWSTTDGSTFEATPIGERGDGFQRIRAVEGGFAAAGSRSRLPRFGAVVWLSSDGRTWKPMGIPSDVRLTADDVTTEGGTLVVVANGRNAPQVWRLADYREHLPQG